VQEASIERKTTGGNVTDKPVVDANIRKEANENGGFNYYQNVNVSKTNAEPNEPIRVVFPTPEDGESSWTWDTTKPPPDRNIARVIPGDPYGGFFAGVDVWWVGVGTTTAYFVSGGMSGPPSGGTDTLTLTIYAV
jgi:hypothetical protein